MNKRKRMDGAENNNSSRKTPLDSSARIHLNIKGQDGVEVFFQIKRSNVLKKALERYCQIRNFQYRTMEFLYNGNHFSHKLTAEDLNMKDVDVIDAMWLQTEVDVWESDCIQMHSHICLVDQYRAKCEHCSGSVYLLDGVEVFFQIKRSTVLKKALEEYCHKRNFQYRAMEFLYNGNRFSHKLTAEALNMDEVDVIDAMWHQTGGGCVGK